VATTVYLVRHANHELIDRMLIGRNGSIGLSQRGLAQAEQLAGHLAANRVTSVQSSPQLRARQTAQPIAAALRLPFLIVPAADELDCGNWTGRSFDELNCDPRWRYWNSDRGSARVPGGEDMRRVQRRIVKHLSNLSTTHCNCRVILVSHAEIIRAAVLHYRNVPLGDFTRVQVDPASVTTLRLTRQGGEVVRANELLHVSVAA
jgi:broad specificity phosphatase PhoE